MIRKNTWIVLGIFAVFLAGFFYLQMNSISLLPEEPTATPTQETVWISGWDSASVQSITFKTADQTVEFKRGADGVWETPDSTYTSGKVEEALSNILSAKVLTMVDASTPFSSMGLEPAAQTITLQNSNQTTLEIGIGDKTSIGSGYYATADQKQAVLIDKSVIEAIIAGLSPQPEPTATPQS